MRPILLSRLAVQALDQRLGKGAVAPRRFGLVVRALSQHDVVVADLVLDEALRVWRDLLYTQKGGLPLKPIGNIEDGARASNLRAAPACLAVQTSVAS